MNDRLHEKLREAVKEPEALGHECPYNHCKLNEIQLHDRAE